MVSDHELKIIFFKICKKIWEKAFWKLHTLYIAFISGRDYLWKDDQNLEETDKLLRDVRAKTDLHLSFILSINRILYDNFGNMSIHFLTVAEVVKEKSYIIPKETRVVY